MQPPSSKLQDGRRIGAQEVHSLGLRHIHFAAHKSHGLIHLGQKPPRNFNDTVGGVSTDNRDRPLPSRFELATCILHVLRCPVEQVGVMPQIYATQHSNAARAWSRRFLVQVKRAPSLHVLSPSCQVRRSTRRNDIYVAVHRD